MPLVPAELQLLLEQGHAAMLQNQQHLLAPSYRDRIYRAIGSEDDYHAKRVRGWLGLLTAQKVLPIWKQAWFRSGLAKLPWPDDIPQPEHLLQHTEAVLVGSADIEIAEAAMQASEAWLLQLDSTAVGLNLPITGFFAGLASVKALLEALGYHPFVGGEPWISADYSDTFDLDLESSDAAKWAAYAWAGREVDSDSNIVKRKEFWEWWLREAIPTAWHMVHG